KFSTPQTITDAGTQTTITLSDVHDPGGPLSSLPAGVYYYRVSAVTAQGELAPSPKASINIVKPGDRVNISLSSVPGATAYRVWGRTQGTWTGLLTIERMVTSTVSGTSFLDYGFTPTTDTPDPVSWLNLTDTTAPITIIGPPAGVTLDGGGLS